MREHELRRQVVGEMHLRRWPTLRPPTLILMWVVMVDEDDRASELAAIEARIADGGSQPDQANPAHRDGTISDRTILAWERHSEGSSITLFVRDADAGLFSNPPGDTELADHLHWVSALPGRLVRATRIWICEREDEAAAIVDGLGFERGELVSCRLAGRARAWSDFRIHEDGFGKLVVAANGTDPRDFTRQVQRLQELGNYRNRALLGLPLAKESWQHLDQAERRLGELARRISETEDRDDELLAELSSLELELVTVATRIGFRMDATAAYARLVEERLMQLDSSAIDGFASLEDFTQRRFLPAVKTCAATVERERQLSLRAAQLTSLLRTRIDTRIENQNAAVLRSMDRSASLQLRLQTLVEGLSVAALSYYMLGLLAYILRGAEDSGWNVDTDMVLAILVVPVVAVLWIAIYSLKSRVLSDRD